MPSGVFHFENLIPEVRSAFFVSGESQGAITAFLLVFAFVCRAR